MSESFPKSSRLRKQSEFDAVYRDKVFAADETLVVQGIVRSPDGEADAIRLGLSISRRVGNAVVRNAWKRRIREAFRKHRESMETELLSDNVPGIDLVARPRRGAKCDYHQIYRRLPKLVRRIVRKLERQVKHHE